MLDLNQNTDLLSVQKLNSKALGLLKLAQNGYLIPPTVVFEFTDLEQIWQTNNIDLDVFKQNLTKESDDQVITELLQDVFA